MSTESSRHGNSLENAPAASESIDDWGGEGRMREALEAQKRKREQAEIADAAVQKSKSIEEEILDDGPIEDPHSDLPEPGEQSARDPETEDLMREALEAKRRQRERAELD